MGGEWYCRGKAGWVHFGRVLLHAPRRNWTGLNEDQNSTIRRSEKALNLPALGPHLRSWHDHDHLSAHRSMRPCSRRRRRHLLSTETEICKVFGTMLR
jgi:hypothetical protein